MSRLVWPSMQARDWALRNFRVLCSHPSVVAVLVFGSAARPVEKSSDLDCLIVYAESRPALEVPPPDVDLRMYEASAVPRLLAEGHDLLGWSLRLGSLICEQDRFWSGLQETVLPQLAFPSPEAADSRAARVERLLDEMRAIGDPDAASEQLLTLLTHRARARLLRAGVFPASRPELPAPLRQIGHPDLAQELDRALLEREWEGELPCPCQPTPGYGARIAHPPDAS